MLAYWLLFVIFAAEAVIVREQPGGPPQSPRCCSSPAPDDGIHRPAL